MNIGEVIDTLRQGGYARRPMWEPGVIIWHQPAAGGRKEHLLIRCRDGEVMPWTPLSWDLLAADWEVTGDDR